MTKQWVKYLQIAAISLNNRLAYGIDHLTSSFFLLLILFVFSQLWKTVLGEGQLAGLGMVQMLWYFAFTEAITLSTPGTHRTLSEEVKSGDIAYGLIRPFYYPSYYLALHWGEFVIRFATNILVGSVFTYFVMGRLEMQWTYFPLWALGISLAVSLNFLVLFSIALIAFWIEDNQPFFWIYSKMIFIFGGLFVPVEAYPAGLRQVSNLLPFRYGVSAPARLIVQFEWSLFWQMLMGQLIWILLMGALVICLFRKGVRKLHVHGG